MNRQERENELLQQMHSEQGRSAILDLFKQKTGIPPGTCAPIGTTVREMIATIVQAEFAA